MRIDIYTDGASSHAGKPTAHAGWSAVVPNFGGGKKTIIRYGHLPPPATNNWGEMAGVMYMLHILREKKDWNLEFYTDSQYVEKSINEWRKRWILTNYEGIKNRELLIPLFTLFDGYNNAKIKWVRGHDGNKWNEVADDFAVRGKKQQVVEINNDIEDVKYIHWTKLPYFNYQ